MNKICLTDEDIERIISIWIKINGTIQSCNNESIIENKLNEEQKKYLKDNIILVWADPDIPGHTQHSYWLTLKKQQGYKYGQNKDNEKKTHPCMIPYKELSFYQKLKDILFISLIKTYKEHKLNKF